MAGDVDAYALLIRRYQPEVAKVVSAMLFSRQDAEDLVQEVFVNAYDKLEQFDVDRDFGKWIKGIARNATRMHLRSSRTKYRHLDAYRDWVHTQHRAGGHRRREERAAALAACCSALPEKQQRMVHMRYRQGREIAGIAAHLQMSVGAVTTALSRLRDALRNCIEQRLATG